MSKKINKNNIEKSSPNNTWESDNFVFIFLILFLCFGFGVSENPKINELEKKVARLEGQMSMIGGKTL